MIKIYPPSPFVVLPQPLASGSLNVTVSNATNSVSGRKKRPINQSDLFIAPPFDELDAVASDGSGEPRRLTNAQLKSLRETGWVDGDVNLAQTGQGPTRGNGGCTC